MNPGGAGPLLLAFASSAERRTCAPGRLLAAGQRQSGTTLLSLQVGLAASGLPAITDDTLTARGLLSGGLAGGLDPALPAGTLLLPDRILATTGSDIAVDRRWHQHAAMALRRLAPVSTAPLAGDAGLVTSPEQKRLLHQASGAVALDMESLALARWSASRGLPFLVLRVLLDPADVALPDWCRVALHADGSTNLPALSLALLRQPGGLVQLLRLLHQTRQAAARWRAALLALGPALAPPAPAA